MSIRPTPVPLSESQAVTVTERFQRRLASITDHTTAASLRAWEQLGTWDRVDIARFTDATSDLFVAARTATRTRPAGYYALLADRPAVVPAVSTVPATDARSTRTGTPSERQRWTGHSPPATRRAEVHNADLVTGVPRSRTSLLAPASSVGAECSPATAARSAPPPSLAAVPLERLGLVRPRPLRLHRRADLQRHRPRPGDQRTSPGNCRRGRSRHPGLRSRPHAGTITTRTGGTHRGNTAGSCTGRRQADPADASDVPTLHRATTIRSPGCRLRSELQKARKWENERRRTLELQKELGVSEAVRVRSGTCWREARSCSQVKCSASSGPNTVSPMPSGRGRRSWPGCRQVIDGINLAKFVGEDGTRTVTPWRRSWIGSRLRTAGPAGPRQGAVAIRSPD